MSYQKRATRILQLIGGKANVISLTHCFTRLRFQLHDHSKAQRDQLSQLEGVISVVESQGQYQIVLGNNVNKIYAQLQPLLDQQNRKVPVTSHGAYLTRILNTIAAIFTPIIPAIAASGMLKGLLAIAVIIAQHYYQLDIKTFDSYIILDAASNAIFYFMPIVLASTSAKVFKCNEYIAMIIGAALCSPALINLMSSDKTVSLFYLLLTKANYTSTVIPIIIAIYVLSYVQRFLERVIPEVLKIIIVPTFSLLIMVPITLIAIGPIGIYLGDYVNALYYYLLDLSPTILGAFIGGVWCLLVIFGAHRAIVPIGINDVATTGKQNLLAFAGAANFSQSGAALGVFLRTKNKRLKTVAASATITALFGITEPAIYGTNLRLKSPMVYAVICGAIGGGIMGWGGAYGSAFANQGILTIPVYAAAGTMGFVCYLIGCTIAFLGSCLMTLLLGFTDLIDDSAESADRDHHRDPAAQSLAD